MGKGGTFFHLLVLIDLLRQGEIISWNIVVDESREGDEHTRGNGHTRGGAHTRGEFPAFEWHQVPRYVLRKSDPSIQKLCM